NDAAQVIVVADASHNEISPFRSLRWRRREGAPILGDPFLGLRRRAVVNGYLVPCLLQEACHRIAHHAEPDKYCLFRHYPISVICFISSHPSAAGRNDAREPP